MRPKRVPQSFLWVALLVSLPTCTASEAARGEGRGEGDTSPVVSEAPKDVVPGVDVLLSDSVHLVRGKRIGLVTNHTGIDARGTPSIDRLMESPDVELVSLFSPEHGIRGDVRGGDVIDSGRDEVTGLPVYSLYGNTRKPTPEMLQGLDVLLFDIQDVGARYYTYISTMALAMEAAGEAGIPFVVLDRPNPIGGVAVQGNVLDPAFSTFVGLYPIPMRHGMTPGELARLFSGEFGVEVELHVVPADGWQRSMDFQDTGLPWVPPSPNMPSLESAYHYPGTCLFEGTNISVGRGTDRAFQILGAPWLNPDSLVAVMETYGLPGVGFQAIRFTPGRPGDGKYGNEEIPGISLKVLSRDYDPTVTALALLREIRRMSGDRWEWRVSHFDRLAGTDALRLGLEADLGMDALQEGWAAALSDFKRLREPYLIYPR